MSVHDVAVAEGTDAAAALRLIGALESGSEHPIGRAVAAHALRRDPELPTVERCTAVAGLGLVGRVDGVDLVVGRAALLEAHGLTVDDDLRRALADRGEAGFTAVLGGWDGRARVMVAVGDTVRPEAAAAIAELRRLGLDPYLVTGDSAATAHAVARAVGIPADHVHAEVLPADKVEIVRRLRGHGRSGRGVAMVGDGVNDAAALAEADLGMTMGGGTDVAIQAGDLTLVRADLGAAPDAIRLARRTLGTIRVNLFWAFAYNVAAIPLAALGLLNPMIAGATMAMSSLFVVSNSLRLRRFT
jgi:Cu+-exporting ATPase